MPDIQVNPTGWGPNGDIHKLDQPGLPPDIILNTAVDAKQEFTRYGRPVVKPFLKVCDFSEAAKKWDQQRADKAKGKGMPFRDNVRGDEDSEFHLVDNKGSLRPKFKFGKGKSKGKGKGKGARDNNPYAVDDRLPGMSRQEQKAMANHMQSFKGKGKGKAKGKGKGKGKGQRNANRFKEWSVNIKPEWEFSEELGGVEGGGMRTEVALSTLGKVNLPASSVQYEDVLWAGELKEYDKQLDRVTVKTGISLQRVETSGPCVGAIFTTAQDDPIIEELFQEQSFHVGTTDQCLAALMAASRSVYSWDIVVSKQDGCILIDKRDESHIDYLTVDENAAEQPSNDRIEDINAPMKLGLEASCINQNFSQQVLSRTAKAKKMDRPNPFQDEEEPQPMASGAYRYRRVILPGNTKSQDALEAEPIHLLVRTEVNCTTGGQYASVKALNEYDTAKQPNWRAQLQTQTGAILATEFKNNAFKMARWVGSALLGSNEVFKLGFVSRKEPKNPHAWSILSVQTYSTKQLASQIGFNEGNAWGIVRYILDRIRSFEDGKYLIVRDPQRAYLQIYKVPWDAFDEPEEDDDDDEEYEDEEGAVAK